MDGHDIGMLDASEHLGLRAAGKGDLDRDEPIAELRLRREKDPRECSLA